MEKIYLSHKMQKRFSLTAIYIFIIRNISSKLEIKLNFYNLKFPEANNKYHIQISYKLWYKPFLWDQEWNKDAHQWHFYLAMIFLFYRYWLLSQMFIISIYLSLYMFIHLYLSIYIYNIYILIWQKNNIYFWVFLFFIYMNLSIMYSALAYFSKTYICEVHSCVQLYFIQLH